MQQPPRGPFGGSNLPTTANGFNPDDPTPAGHGAYLPVTDEDMERFNLHALVLDCLIDELPPGSPRTALGFLRESGLTSATEAAERLGLPKAWMRTNVHRAFVLARQLKERLGLRRLIDMLFPIDD